MVQSESGGYGHLGRSSVTRHRRPLGLMLPMPARQHLGGHRGRDHIGVALSIDGLVADARGDDATLAPALVTEFGRFIEAVAFDIAFCDEPLQMRVRNLDALLFEGRLAILRVQDQRRRSKWPTRWIAALAARLE